ncbi:MAG: hypothetical protein JWP13_482 [Candidatus Saccharibacteria bacterium]|nr:hypothetical protein [Candidatus Saccharibacteria bacterium]
MRLAEELATVGRRIGRVGVSAFRETDGQETAFWTAFNGNLSDEELAALPEHDYETPRIGESSQGKPYAALPQDHIADRVGVYDRKFTLPYSWRVLPARRASGSTVGLSAGEVIATQNPNIFVPLVMGTFAVGAVVGYLGQRKARQSYRVALADKYAELREKIQSPEEGSIWLPDERLSAEITPDIAEIDIPGSLAHDSLEAHGEHPSYFWHIDSAGEMVFEARTDELAYCIADSSTYVKLRPGESGELKPVRMGVQLPQLIEYALKKAGPTSRELWYDDGVQEIVMEMSRTATRMKYIPTPKDSQDLIMQTGRLLDVLYTHCQEADMVAELASEPAQ